MLIYGCHPCEEYINSTLLHRKHQSGWRKSRECKTSEQSEAAETGKGAEQSEAAEQRKAAELGMEQNWERSRTERGSGTGKGSGGSTWTRKNKEITKT